MDSGRFIRLCEKELTKIYEELGVDTKNLYIYTVWMSKTLQNNKALLSTSISDGKYYEFTFNGDKNELYIDSYQKFNNQCIEIHEKPLFKTYERFYDDETSEFKVSIDCLDGTVLESFIFPDAVLTIDDINSFILANLDK